jgi:imidazolonepropionase-like amidohydrolase
MRAWLLLCALSVPLGVATCATSPHRRQPVPAADVALVGGAVFTAPDAPAIVDGVVLVSGGHISAVGARQSVRVPAGTRVIDCAGASVLAGFWNSHVHFSESKWTGADTAQVTRLSRELEGMLTRWGFVRVVDTGSPLENTLALRRRIASGEVRGPEILTAGMPFVPPNGTPFYVAPIRLPELASPDAARAAVRERIDAGADVVKVFAASPVAPGRTVVMPLDVLRAATSAAHESHRLVVAHPTSVQGAERALEGGVDILAHTTPDDGHRWSGEFAARLVAAGVSLVPTLELWTWELGRKSVPATAARQFIAVAQQQLKAFADAGGSILFGTDVGYVTDYDPTVEYALMSDAGLPFARILASLTTEPARRFGVADAGRIAAGMRADLVVVDGRPDTDVRRLAQVAVVLRDGRVVYERR